MLPTAATPTPLETIPVRSRTVACDGGDLGHPKVWLRIEERETLCPYCSRLFVLRDPVAGGDPPDDEVADDDPH